jgi:hypothetical protein
MFIKKTHKIANSYHFGLKILFDSYLIAGVSNSFKSMIINVFLFDSYLIKVMK